MWMNDVLVVMKCDMGLVVKWLCMLVLVDCVFFLCGMFRCELVVLDDE